MIGPHGGPGYAFYCEPGPSCVMIRGMVDPSEFDNQPDNDDYNENQLNDNDGNLKLQRWHQGDVSNSGNEVVTIGPADSSYCLAYTRDGDSDVHITCVGGHEIALTDIVAEELAHAILMLLGHE